MYVCVPPILNRRFIHLQHPELQQKDEGPSPDDADGTTFGPSLETKEDGPLEEGADQTTGTDLPNSAKLIEGPVDGITLLATTPPIVTNVIDQPLSQSQIYAEREDIENAKRASERTFEVEEAARKAAASAALTPATNPGTTVFSSAPAADEGSFEVEGGDTIHEGDGAIADPNELGVTESEVSTSSDF